jgi:hypothetical protein
MVQRRERLAESDLRRRERARSLELVEEVDLSFPWPDARQGGDPGVDLLVAEPAEIRSALS